MIQMQTFLDVADNTGAKRVQCIMVSDNVYCAETATHHRRGLTSRAAVV